MTVFGNSSKITITIMAKTIKVYKHKIRSDECIKITIYFILFRTDRSFFLFFVFSDAISSTRIIFSIFVELTQFFEQSLKTHFFFFFCTQTLDRIGRRSAKTRSAHFDTVKSGRLLPSTPFQLQCFVHIFNDEYKVGAAGVIPLKIERVLNC